MTAVKQRAINIINVMPETEVMQFVIKNKQYEEPKAAGRKKVSGKEGREALERMRQHVEDLGLPEMTLDEINAEIAEVRAERKARKAAAK